MGWAFFIIVVIIVIVVAVKKRNSTIGAEAAAAVAAATYDLRANQRRMDGGQGAASNMLPYPQALLQMMEQLPEPDMRKLVDYAFKKGMRFCCDEIICGLDDNEMGEALDYIQKYKRYVPGSAVFCYHEYICDITNQAFVDIFRARPELLYKNRGLVETQYFIGQFEIYCNNQVQTHGSEVRGAGYDYFLDNWKDFPAQEANCCNVPTEQTNWYAVLSWLSEKVKNPDYVAYPLRYAQELLKISDPDLHFVGDFAARVEQDENYVNVDLERTKKFIEDYMRCIDTKLDEMGKYATTLMVATASFVKAIMLRPEFLYKSANLLSAQYFDSQLGIELEQQAFDGQDTDYKLYHVKQREYRDMMANFPAKEAANCGIPIKETNWYEVVRCLSAVTDAWACPKCGCINSDDQSECIGCSMYPPIPQESRGEAADSSISGAQANVETTGGNNVETTSDNKAGSKIYLKAKKMPVVRIKRCPKCKEHTTSKICPKCGTSLGK